MIEQSHVLYLTNEWLAVAYLKLAFPPLMLSIHLEAQIFLFIFMAGPPYCPPPPPPSRLSLHLERQTSGAGELVTL